MAISSQGGFVVEVETLSANSACRRVDKACDVVCCLRVPNRLLQEWYEQFDASSTNLVELLNEAVRGRIVTVDVHCERLQLHLYRRAGDVARKAAKTKPHRARQSYLGKSTMFDVYQGETVDATAVMEELEDTVLDDGEDIAEWAKKCDGYQETIALLKERLRAATPHEGSSQNIGLPINQVGERQRKRKLSQLKTSTEKALWFVSSFGLDVQSVTMSDSSGSSVVLNYTDTSQPTPSPTPAPSDHAIAQTLFLLERFGVSDEFYHELAMLNPTLSRYMCFMVFCYDYI